MGGMPSVGVFLRDPSPYLREFGKKLQKTPKGWIDKRDLIPLNNFGISVLLHGVQVLKQRKIPEINETIHYLALQL